MNALLLMMLCEKQNYKLPVFCTFNRAVGLNYTTDKQGAKKPITDADGQPLPRVGINKGEKSFPVMLTTFTVVDKDTKEKINYEDLPYQLGAPGQRLLLDFQEPNYVA